MATDLTLNTSNIPAPVSDGESDIAAAVVGAGTLLIQACAIMPGLLPCLLLLLPLVLPPLVLGAVAGLFYGAFAGVRGLVRLAGRLWNRRAERPSGAGLPRALSAR